MRRENFECIKASGKAVNSRYIEIRITAIKYAQIGYN